MPPRTPENLFRQQAVRSLHRKSAGRPIARVPPSWTGLCILLIVAVISAVTFLCSAEYARKERVRGWLVSGAGVVRVVNDVAAVVVGVVPEPGERVAAGDPLIYLSADSALPDGAGKSERILAGLREEVAETRSQIRLSREHERLEAQSLRKQLQQLEVETAALVAESLVIDDRVNRERDKLQRLENGARRGAVAEWDLLAQREALSALQQERSRSIQALAANKRECARTRGRLLEIPVQGQLRRSSLRSNNAQLSQKIAEQESRRLAVIRAPMSGVVGTVEVSPGNSAAARQLLMTLLPQDLELVAELYMPSRAAGFVDVGQNVRLLYDALPHKQFGTFSGRVDRVADYVLLPQEIPQTFHYAEATYKVRVGIRDSVIETSAGRVQLRPGMLLTAEVILESRNLIEWLLEPLRLRRSSIA